MATTTRVRGSSAAAEREHHRTNLWAQLARFVGLFLSPGLGLIVAWLLHVWVMGVSLHWGPIDVERRTPAAAPFVAVAIVTAATIGLSVMGWHMVEHRKPVLRYALAGSIAVVGVLFAINLGAGLTYWWGPLFVVASWAVAVVWSINRLDVARNDKTGDEKGEDGFLEKHGLKGWRARKVTPVTDRHGRPVATEIEFEHAEGDTVDQLQDAVPAFESATGSPTGMSDATGDDRADRSHLRVMHVDPLKESPELPPLSSPGGSIADPLLIGLYKTGDPVKLYVAGGQGFTPTSLMWMGMTRSGKTSTENEAITEMESRRDVVILYLNRAKGMQDIRTVIPGIEAAVITDEDDKAGLYREAMIQLKKIFGYRQRQLALFGVDAWTPQCYSSPPWRTDETGRRVQMEPMPFLIAHFGEADDILQEDRHGESVYLASKGLSLGVATSWSLQRADHTKMPTGLRFNISARLCFGCGDSESVEFALTDDVVKAGAHPEYWRAFKPGYFYFIGPNVDPNMFPVFARSYGKTENGGSVSAELLRRNMAWAPRMAKLDAGSVAATGGWWEKTVAETNSLREQLLTGAAPQVAPQTSRSAEDEDAQTDRETREEMEREMRITMTVEGVELYPQVEGGGATPEHANMTFPPVPANEEVSWESEKPAARDRNAAIEALRKALLELSGDESLRDPSDPTGRTIILRPGMVHDRYPFRSRPWFTEALIDMATGKLDAGNGLVLTSISEPGSEPGSYRLQIVPDGHVR